MAWWGGAEEPKGAEEESPGEDEGGFWGFVSKAADIYKRDLTEFVQTVQQDTTKAIDSIQSGETQKEVQTMLTGKKDVKPRVFNRYQSRVAALQRDQDTFLRDVEHEEGYEEWRATFDVESRTDTISQALVAEHLQKTHSELVPEHVEYTTFWVRYYFALHKLEQEERRREAVVQRAHESDEEEGWGWDEDEDLDTKFSEDGALNGEDDVTTAAVEEKEEKEEAGAKEEGSHNEEGACAAEGGEYPGPVSVAQERDIPVNAATSEQAPVVAERAPEQPLLTTGTTTVTAVGTTVGAGVSGAEGTPPPPQTAPPAPATQPHDGPTSPAARPLVTVPASDDTIGRCTPEPQASPSPEPWPVTPAATQRAEGGEAHALVEDAGDDESVDDIGDEEEGDDWANWG